MRSDVTGESYSPEPPRGELGEVSPLGFPDVTTSPDSSTRPSAAIIQDLQHIGWRSVPVREEIRTNALRKIAAGEPIVGGVLGFDDTIIPQLEHALIAGHDVIFLGERGQAKSRIIRSLIGLLDEWMPIVRGSEINDDPYHPVSAYARELVADLGPETPISWVHRSERYGEKLATPDTSIADLIGEVDPIKVAEGRYLSDELTIHYGLVPRTNRGIFAINELPDLPERIQVGLLNVLEERDVQIRGHRIRLPLDVLLVASANPDDYTSRGRIITPLKDRFGAQIRTHYPQDVATEVAITDQESAVIDVPGVTVTMPPFMAEIVARISQIARQSPRINQRSGVSLRASIANYETLVAASLRRALRLGDAHAVPRPSDLDALVSSTLGKVEIEVMEDDEDLEVVHQLLRAAVLQTYREHCAIEALDEVVAGFDQGMTVELGTSIPASVYVGFAAELPELADAVTSLLGEDASIEEQAAAIELVLEGLHLSRRLNKNVVDRTVTYRSR
jgi:magnesium chelatase subunit I